MMRSAGTSIGRRVDVAARSGRGPKRAMRALAALVLLAGCVATPRSLTESTSESLRSEVLAQLRGATYEVVVEKPKTDSLSYEKPLPLDLLPYRTRNDKYASIGTAFAIDGGQFVSAGHVVALGSESIRRRIFLRDSNGKILQLDRVLKFSAPRDFIVFTVKDHQAPSTLQTKAVPAPNDKVFAVGNALGEGIIVRDGLYTSDTPEEDEGRWNWMRFSAAVSPGNSGGPLVDREGRVVGIVLRKSPNENLNFALPIGEVLRASPRSAEIRLKAIFKLDVTDRTLLKKTNESIDLPARYMAFGEALQTIFSRFNRNLAAEFNAAHRDDMFPVSTGSQPLLYQTDVSASFPRLIAKQNDGTWAAVAPNDVRTAEIGKDGLLSFGKMGSFMYMRLKAPEGISVKQLGNDSKLFMDVLLRGLYFSRSFGNEKVRITSLGPANGKGLFVDSYGRKWEVRRWTIEHSDDTVVTYSLPMPGGYAIMLNSADESVSEMFETDMKTLTDYMFVTYYGTLKQWHDFLSLKEMLPPAFHAIRIDARYGREFRYQSPRFSFSYPATLMKVTEDSDLHVKFSYFKERGRVVWDVSSVLVGEHKDTTVFVLLRRHPHPPSSMPETARSTWLSVVNARLPYTGSSFFDKSRTVIAAAHPPATTSNGDLAKLPVVYTVVYSADGTLDAVSMQRTLAGFRDKIKIHEYAGAQAEKPPSTSAAQLVGRP